MLSVISASFMIAIICIPDLPYSLSDSAFLFSPTRHPLPTLDDLVFPVCHRDLEFYAPAVFDLRQPNSQYAISHLGGSVPHTDSPAQRNEATKFPITALRTKMR